MSYKVKGCSDLENLLALGTSEQPVFVLLLENELGESFIEILPLLLDQKVEGNLVVALLFAVLLKAEGQPPFF